MMILVWGVLAYIGYHTERLRLKPFLIMIAVIVPFTFGYDFLQIQEAKMQGRNESFRLTPLVIAGDVLVTWALWSATYLLGYAAGTRRRRRAAIKRDFE